jgi:hypothetical protein
MKWTGAGEIKSMYLTLTFMPMIKKVSALE